MSGQDTPPRQGTAALVGEAAAAVGRLVEDAAQDAAREAKASWHTAQGALARALFGVVLVGVGMHALAWAAFIALATLGLHPAVAALVVAGVATGLGTIVCLSARAALPDPAQGVGRVWGNILADARAVRDGWTGKGDGHG